MKVARSVTREAGRAITRARPAALWMPGEHTQKKLESHGRMSVVNQKIVSLERARTHRRNSIKVDAADYFKALSEQKSKPAVKRQWYILDPLSNAVKRWDLVTAIVLMYTAFATPFEVAFLKPPTSGNDALFIINRLVDTVFILDMILQFFLMCPAPKNERVSSMYETRPRAIAARYLSGWFWIDAGSILPSLLDVLTLNSDTEDSRGTSPLTTLRVIRALRLFKLVRLVRSSRVLQRLMIRVATPRATVTLLSLICECMLVAHAFACALGMSATFPASPLDTWEATHGFCRPNGTDAFGVRLAECVSTDYLYVRALYWGGGLMVGSPVSLRPDKGPFDRHYSDPSDATDLTTMETLVVMLIRFVAALHWARVIARFVFVFNNLDPDVREFQVGWDALNRFCSFFKIEPRAAMSLRQYYMERSDEMRATSRLKVMRWFSPLLAEECVWDLNKEWLVTVPCFSLVMERASDHAEAWRYLVNVALSMDVAVFVPKDRPPPARLYLITQGSAVYKSRTLGPGESWGAEDVVLSASHRKRPRAYCTTYLHVRWISTEAFVQLGRQFPRSYFLTKFWALMRAAAEWMLEEYRNQKLEGMQLTADDLARRLNGEDLLHPLGAMRKMYNTDAKGQSVYTLKHQTLQAGVLQALQGRLLITKTKNGKFKVTDPGPPPKRRYSLLSYRQKRASVVAEQEDTADEGNYDGEEGHAVSLAA